MLGWGGSAASSALCRRGGGAGAVPWLLLGALPPAPWFKKYQAALGVSPHLNLFHAIGSEGLPTKRGRVRTVVRQGARGGDTLQSTPLAQQRCRGRQPPKAEGYALVVAPCAAPRAVSCWIFWFIISTTAGGREGSGAVRGLSGEPQMVSCGGAGPYPASWHASPAVPAGSSPSAWSGSRSSA